MLTISLRVLSRHMYHTKRIHDFPFLSQEDKSPPQALAAAPRRLLACPQERARVMTEIIVAESGAKEKDGNARERRGENGDVAKTAEDVA